MLFIVFLLSSFLVLFWERIFGIRWHRYFTGRMPFLLPNQNSVKALKKMHSEWPGLIPSFMLALQRQYP